MGLNFSKLGITTLDQKFSFGIGAIFGGTVMNVLRGILRLGNDSNPDASDLCGTYRCLGGALAPEPSCFRI